MPDAAVVRRRAAETHQQPVDTPSPRTAAISSPVPRVVARRASRWSGRQQLQPGGARHLDHAHRRRGCRPRPRPGRPSGPVTDRRIRRAGLRRHERVQRPLPAVGQRHQLERVAGSLAPPAGLDRLGRLPRRQRAAELVGSTPGRAWPRLYNPAPNRPGRARATVTMSREELVGIAHAERQRLGRMIQYADPDTWEQPSAAAGWWNRDVMAHLARRRHRRRAAGGRPARRGARRVPGTARRSGLLDRRLERLDREPARGLDDPRAPGDVGRGRGVAARARRAARATTTWRDDRLPVARRRHRADLPRAVARRRVVPARRGHAGDQRRRRGLAGQLAALAGLPHDRPRRAHAARGRSPRRATTSAGRSIKIDVSGAGAGVVALGPRRGRGSGAHGRARRGHRRARPAVGARRRSTAVGRRRPRPPASLVTGGDTTLADLVLRTIRAYP